MEIFVVIKNIICPFHSSLQLHRYILQIMSVAIKEMLQIFPNSQSMFLFHFPEDDVFADEGKCCENEPNIE